MNVLHCIRALGLVAILSLLLSGCDNHRKTSTVDEVKVRTSAPVYQPPAPATASIKLRGPRPAAEVEQLFRPVQAQLPLPPIQRETRAKVPFPVDDGKVVADPAWDVPITREWYHIVIHHSASVTGSAGAFDRAHRERGWEGLGYHFVIGNGTGSGDGEVEVGYRWTRQLAGAHAGHAEYNQHGVGICLVGAFEQGSQPSPRQLASLRRLVRFIQVKTAISTAEIIGHYNVPDKKTACPGDFDVSGFRKSLGGNAIPVPIHYTSTPPRAGATTVLSRSGAALP